MLIFVFSSPFSSCNMAEDNSSSYWIVRHSWAVSSSLGCCWSSTLSIRITPSREEVNHWVSFLSLFSSLLFIVFRVSNSLIYYFIINVEAIMGMFRERERVSEEGWEERWKAGEFWMKKMKGKWWDESVEHWLSSICTLEIFKLIILYVYVHMLSLSLLRL